jgi:hypothetical protein
LFVVFVATHFSLSFQLSAAAALVTGRELEQQSVFLQHRICRAFFLLVASCGKEINNYQQWVCGTGFAIVGSPASTVLQLLMEEP